MSSGILINGTKYMYIHHKYDYNVLSIYDRLYFILRDIFANTGSIYIIMKAIDLNHSLTGGISFEKTPNSFGYSTILNNKYFVDNLFKLLNDISIDSFEFLKPKEGEEINIDKYMKWDEWWDKFIELRKLIKQRYEKICMREEENIERNSDIVHEYEYEYEYDD